MKHLIFDCDGVLVDSEILAQQVLLEYIRPLGFTGDQRELRRRFTGKIEADIIAELSTESNMQIPDNFHLNMMDTLHKKIQQELQPVAGMRDLVRSLKTPKSVASNSKQKQVRESLAITQMDDFFDQRYYTRDMVVMPKPAPDVYLFAVEEIGIHPDDVWVIEDSLTGVRSAKAAGLKVIGFAGASHNDVDHIDDLKKVGADLTALDAAELEKIIRELGYN